MTCRIRTGDRQFLDCCSTTEPTSSWNAVRQSSAYAQRQRRAHRAGLGTRTTEGFRSDAPHDRLSPTGHSSGAVWLLFLPPGFLHHPRRSIGTRRTCAGMEVPLPRWQVPPDASGRSGTVKPYDACASPCERQKQNAPGREPEGVRIASGDRGDRSPRAGSVDEAQATLEQVGLPWRTQGRIAHFRRCIRFACDEAIRVHEME